ANYTLQIALDLRFLMFRRLPVLIALVFLTLFVASCHHNKVANPIANVNSKQPDKVLFDRAMDAMNHGKYDVARMTLQTLINTYPDSEYVARAKLAVGDSWYAEGSTEVLAQREFEIGRFYYLRESWPAAIARLKSLTDAYPLFSQADEALYMLGNANEKEAELVRGNHQQVTGTQAQAAADLMKKRAIE